MKQHVFVLIVALVARVAVASPTTARIDAYVRQQLSSARIPAVSIAVDRGGRLAYANGYGVENVENPTPATSRTVYQIASVTKPFTAVGIMMLVEQGKLALDDSITHVLPELPAAWSGVTIRHLLTNTSGIASYSDLPELVPAACAPHTPQELLAPVIAHPVSSPPGTRYYYNNTGYYLLGLTIERVSGESYEQFLTSHIFTPLGMSNTRLNSWTTVIPHRAAPYTLTALGWENALHIHPTLTFSAGGLVSTVEDLSRWELALAQGRLVKPATLQQIWTPGTLNNGTKTAYGFGWQLTTINGHRAVAHNGTLPGVTSRIVRFPDDNITVMLLSNRDSVDANTMTQTIAGFYVPALAPKPVRPIVDPEPEVTAMLRQVVIDFSRGEVNREQFTPEMQTMLSPQIVAMARRLLTALGPLNAFTLVGREVRDDLRVLRYQAVFGTTPRFITITLTPDNKIADVDIGG